MSASDYTLTEAEVRSLTGAVRKSKQMEWFISRGVPCELGADGKVKVARAAADALMLPSRSRQRPTARGPNLDALKKAS